MVTERPVEVTTKSGNVIRAIETRSIETSHSTSTNTRAILILLPAGLKYRVGPHRLYVDLARFLAKSSITTYRMDPPGLGYSDGVLLEGATRELWTRVEEGLFVADVIEFAKDVANQHPNTPIVLSGICGGAVTGLFACCAEQSLFDGLISINTAISVSKEWGNNTTVSTAKTKKNVAGYSQKVFSKAAWSRILKGEVNFRRISTVLINFFKHQFIQEQTPDLEDMPYICHRFVTSFNELKSRQFKHLLMFSENDNRWLEFKDLAYAPLLDSNPNLDNTELYIIKDSNHEIFYPEWQREFENKIKFWFLTRFSL